MPDGNDDKMFTCRWCGVALATEEVVPLSIEQYCGFVVACARCAESAVQQGLPAGAEGASCF